MSVEIWLFCRIFPLFFKQLRRDLLSAFRADGQILEGCAGFLADVFELIHGREILAAFVAGLHFKSATPDFTFIAG